MNNMIHYYLKVERRVCLIVYILILCGRVVLCGFKLTYLSRRHVNNI